MTSLWHRFWDWDDRQFNKNPKFWTYFYLGFGIAVVGIGGAGFTLAFTWNKVFLSVIGVIALVIGIENWKEWKKMERARSLMAR